ncbi:Flagellin N-methylase [Phycisphaerae bacterium RAS1]|nr:Flagellin N-methylase [Phycisphaerae bacterium RAS1]
MSAQPAPDSPAADSPWYRAGLKFSCTQCGNCCAGAPGYVWVSRDEIAALGALFNLSPDEFEARHTRKVGFRRSLLERRGGDCEFLRHDPDGKRRCGVYAARPVQCRTWPFWGSNLESADAWRYAGRGCPGIDKGEHHPLPVIQGVLELNAGRPL